MTPPGESKPRMIVDPSVSFKFTLGDLNLRCEDKDFAEKKGKSENP
jgi:hypothetical protein